jgi:hypothetical protein
MLTGGFFGSLSGILLSLFSTLFLLNDLKNQRTYMIVGGGATFERKVTIRRDRSPLLFKAKVAVTALCTALTLVMCLAVLIIGLANSTDLLQEMATWQVVSAFIPYSLVLLYVFESVSVRVFAKSWDNEGEGPQTLGLGGDNNRDEARG